MSAFSVNVLEVDPAGQPLGEKRVVDDDEDIDRAEDLARDYAARLGSAEFDEEERRWLVKDADGRLFQVWAG